MMIIIVFLIIVTIMMIIVILLAFLRGTGHVDKSERINRDGIDHNLHHHHHGVRTEYLQNEYL